MDSTTVTVYLLSLVSTIMFVKVIIIPTTAVSPDDTVFLSYTTMFSMLSPGSISEI